MRVTSKLLCALRAGDGKVYLRDELQRLAKSQKIDDVIGSLIQRGYLQEINSDTFLFNRTPKVSPASASQVQRLRLHNRIKRQSCRSSTSIARFVNTLARLNRVTYRRTYMDCWAESVTRLAGDDPKSDTTENLLVALTREGKLAARDMVRLIAAHQRELKCV